MKKIITTVFVNNFVKRQTKTSGKTYTNNLNYKDIALHAQDQLAKGNYKKGYREGVLIAHVSNNLIHKFVCPYTKINNNTKIIAKLVKRRKEEQPYIQLRALNGKPLKTGSAELILYRHDVLKETNENCFNNGYELISFNAIPKNIKSMPMSPVTMMRNQLQLIGGTKGNYKSEEWAESIKFWQDFIILKP